MTIRQSRSSTTGGMESYELDSMMTSQTNGDSHHVKKPTKRRCDLHYDEVLIFTDSGFRGDIPFDETLD